MTIVLFSTLIWKVVDFLRFLVARDRSSITTQATAWIAGVLVVWLGSSADLTADLTFPGIDASLGSLDGGSIVLLGLLASSLASSLVDVKQAVDNSDSSRVPRLVSRG